MLNLNQGLHGNLKETSSYKVEAETKVRITNQALESNIDKSIEIGCVTKMRL